MTKILELYNKYCPLKKSQSPQKHKNEKPWITKGLENACKKKNTLYKLFIKHRTEEAEKRYKLYKNKLVNIIRANKKDYYQKQLEQHKGNIQATWKTLNSIIKKGKSTSGYPNYFIKDSLTLHKSKEIANEFNNFFVKVGPSLANEIKEPGDTDNLKENLIKQNPHSCVIKRVEEQEIINIVRNLKNKKSTDSTNIDMILIKNIIQ